MSTANEPHIGDNVKVVSGPHEGRAGRLIYTREVSVGGSEAEDYGIVEFQQVNAEDKLYTDHISVPVRRLAKK